MGKMRRVGMRIGIALLCLLLLCGVLLLGSYGNHRMRLLEEDILFVPMGQAVQVDGHALNVYTEGTGGRTLVFLSGGGTCSPVLDFRTLYRQLSGTYRVAVVERAGYGFSEVTDSPRDVATVCNQTRQALALSGIEAPYVLCPHSLSGLEALYWARNWPDEVEAVVGLDMAVPAAYEGYRVNSLALNVMSFGAKVGVTRFLPGVAESDAIRYGTLTEEEKAVYRAVFYRRTATADMLNEMAAVKENAARVGTEPLADVPVLLFSSNGEGTGWEEQDWRRFQREFAARGGSIKLVELDCSHYVHDIEYGRIAEEIRGFFDE